MAAIWNKEAQFVDAAEQELRTINRADDSAEGLTPQRNRW
jgi:hypothetical protein